MEDTLFWSFVAGLGMWLIECSYLPQLHRLHKLKASHEISPSFPALNLAGRSLATLYAFHIGATVLAIGFFFGWLVRTTFLIQVLYYRWRPGGRTHPAQEPAPEKAASFA